MRGAVAATLCFCFAYVGYSADIYVPDTYQSIQAAVYYAQDGDTIIVRPGTYTETINFIGRKVTVRSEKGPVLTVIDANGSGSAFKFVNGEGRDSVVEGFTLRGGSGTLDPLGLYSGGAIYCQGSSPRIAHNIFTMNAAATGYGGAIYCMSNSTPTIAYNKITQNTSARCGSGIYCRGSSAFIFDNQITWNSAGGCGGGIACSLGTEATILNNLIAHNTAEDTGGAIACFRASPSIVNNIIVHNSSDFGGGGIDCWRESSPQITNNTISENNAIWGGGGLSCHERCFPKVSNTIFWNNSALQGNEIWIGSAVEPSYITIGYTNITGGFSSVHSELGSGLIVGQGIIDADPLFVDPLADDFHLTISSPCINAGAPGSVVPIPAHDFEGDDRVAFERADIGADEAALHLYYRGQAIPGGEVSIVCVGLSNMAVLLALGSSKKNEPLQTPWGLLYLNGPFYYSLLGDIPSNGALVKSFTVPLNWIPGHKYPFQALCSGLAWLDPLLTNLMTLPVE